MTLRDDIRSHFEQQAIQSPTPAGFRAAVTARAAQAHPGQRRSVQWAGAIAAMLAVAIVVGLLAAGGLRHSRSAPAVSGSNARLGTPSPNPSPTPTPVACTPGTPSSTPGPPAAPASGVSVVEVDPVDSSTGYALMAGTLASGGWREFLFSATRDGGATWSTPVQVGTPLPQGMGDSGEHIHFADCNDGFVYGNTAAYVTHDGGQTWQDAGFNALEVIGVVGDYSWTWAVLYPCAKGIVCPYQVRRSNDGGRTWNETLPLPGQLQPVQVVATPYGGVLISGNGTGDMYVTADGGVIWTTVAGRCSPDSGMAYVATADGFALWEMCSGAFPDFAPRSVYYTKNQGSIWAQGTAVAAAGSPAQLVSPTSGKAVLATSSTPIEVSVDQGRSWTPVTQAAGFSALVLAPSGYAWAVSASGAIWASADGGSTWTELPAQPG
jgi:photosystem II stability/assembly factor-like uncharacterized protein